MSRTPRYAAHRDFVAPALGTPGARPVILGFILVESLYRLGQQILGLALGAFSPSLAEDVFDGSTPLGLLINLGSFVILGLALALVLTRVHGRGLATLLGPPARAWPQFRATFLTVALLFLLFEAALGGFAPDPEASLRPVGLWLALLLPGMAALMIQIGSEELFYRGYLQQQVAALMPSPWAWLVLPNIAFAFAHVSPYVPLADNAAYLVWTFCFGLAASDLTARSGTLGPALGLHLANNAYAFLFFGEAGGPDSGLALVLYPPADPTAPDLPASPMLGLGPELMLLGFTWVAARLVLRR